MSYDIPATRHDNAFRAYRESFWLKVRRHQARSTVFYISLMSATAATRDFSASCSVLIIEATNDAAREQLKR